ncbi:hypothetical protein U1Q18_040370 [Sarracenia purpurea var. burkii]
MEKFKTVEEIANLGDSLLPPPLKLAIPEEDGRDSDFLDLKKVGWDGVAAADSVEDYDEGKNSSTISDVSPMLSNEVNFQISEIKGNNSDVEWPNEGDPVNSPGACLDGPNKTIGVGAVTGVDQVFDDMPHRQQGNLEVVSGVDPGDDGVKSDEDEVHSREDEEEAEGVLSVQETTEGDVDNAGLGLKTLPGSFLKLGQSFM